MVLKKIFVTFFVLALFPRLVLADAELWSLNIIQFPYREKVKINVIPELRFRNGISELYYFQTYIGPALFLSESFEVDLYYALNFSQNAGGWSAKSLGYVDAIYKYTSPWFVFSNRGRFEYDTALSVLKYRNLFGFSRDGWFAGDELFYNFNKAFFDEGRSSLGYAIKVGDDCRLNLGYMLRRQKQNVGDDWLRTNVVNLGLKVVL